jgi:hypothetical protein
LTFGIIRIVKMSCIICQESGPEPLRENCNCSCKYKRHDSCWIDYVHSTAKVKCLLCRKEIVAPPKTRSSMNKTVNPIQVTSETAPYSQSLLPAGQRISYEEFCEIIHSHNNSYQNAPSTPHQQPQQQEKKKTLNTFTKVVLGLCIIAVIVLIVVVIF